MLVMVFRQICVNADVKTLFLGWFASFSMLVRFCVRDATAPVTRFRSLSNYVIHFSEAHLKIKIRVNR